MDGFDKMYFSAWLIERLPHFRGLWNTRKFSCISTSFLYSERYRNWASWGLIQPVQLKSTQYHWTQIPLLLPSRACQMLFPTLAMLECWLQHCNVTTQVMALNIDSNNPKFYFSCVGGISVCWFPGLHDHCKVAVWVGTQLSLKSHEDNQHQINPHIRPTCPKINSHENNLSPDQLKLHEACTT